MTEHTMTNKAIFREVMKILALGLHKCDITQDGWSLFSKPDPEDRGAPKALLYTGAEGAEDEGYIEVYGVKRGSGQKVEENAKAIEMLPKLHRLLTQLEHTILHEGENTQ